jgi:hypothetical protein
MKKIMTMTLMVMTLMAIGLCSCSKDDTDDGNGDSSGGLTAAGKAATAVDLGLSVKWASYNVGAVTPEGYGEEYSWGEGLQSDNITNICGTKYDVARNKWGGNWRMPTYEEIEELNSKCLWAWSESNGVLGMKATGPNGNSIFFPVVGADNTHEVERNIWSGTKYNYSNAYALHMGFERHLYSSSWGGWESTNYDLLSTKLSIRPVLGKAQ